MSGFTREAARRDASAGVARSSRRREAPSHAYAIPSQEGSRRISTDSRRHTIDPRRIPMDPDGVYTQRNGFRGEAAHTLCASACAPDSASVHRRFASTTTERRTGLEVMADVLEKLDQVGEVVGLASDVVSAQAGEYAGNARASNPLHAGNSRVGPQARHSVSPSRSSPSRAGGLASPASSSISYASNCSHASTHSNTPHLRPDVARHPPPTVTRSPHAHITYRSPNITRLLNFFIAWMKRNPDAVVPHVCRSAPLVSSPAVLVALIAYVARNHRLRDAPVDARGAPVLLQREASEASQLALKSLAHYLLQCGEARRDGRSEDASASRQENSTDTHHQIRYHLQSPSGDAHSRHRHRQHRRRNVWLAYLADLDDHNARAFVYDCVRIVHWFDSEDRKNAGAQEQGHDTTAYPGQGHHSIVNQGHYQTVSHGHYSTSNSGQYWTATQGALALRRCLMDDALYVARRLQQRGVALSELYCGSELLKALRRERMR
ncbi:hypothetical protein K523DRAFT_242275 [Schizophyllum commune Tattone D]|nr:hypothetical protein K523DRAFT_242275 [Schizophyllum commune Tattone D]